MTSKTPKFTHIRGTSDRGWTLRNAMIIVANIPLDVSEEEFRRRFSNVTDIDEFRFLDENGSGSDTKIAIIQFSSTQIAVESVDLINGQFFNGKMLTVFSVKGLRDYVRIPGSTFLVASQDSDFSNKQIFRTFRPFAHIDHFFTNPRNKSNPKTGVAVFKDSNEYLKAERLIKSWKAFEDEHIMAIKVPCLDDFYPDGKPTPRSFSSEHASKKEIYSESGTERDYVSDSELYKREKEQSDEKRKVEEAFSISWKTAYFVPKKKAEGERKEKNECKVDYCCPEQIWEGDSYDKQLFDGFPLFVCSSINDRNDSNDYESRISWESTESYPDYLLSGVL